MTLLEELAQKLAVGSPARRSASAADAVVIHVLDTVGAWIAGRATFEGRYLARLRTGTSGAPALLNASPLDLVSLRVATARLTEVDDVHMPSCTTPGAVVVMTALTLATNGFLDQNDETQLFADAIHDGYEILTRLGESISGPEILHRGIWPTLLLAPIAAAAVTAKLLNLDRERTAHALAIALTVASGRPGGSVSGGVVASAGTSARWLLVGLAAKAGCAAAISAASGFNGDLALLDSDWLSSSHGVKLSPDLSSEFYREQCAVQNTSIKPYCAAKQGIAAIDGFVRLLKEGVPLAALTKVRVKVPTSHVGMIGHLDIGSSRLSRITSCGYNLALAAMRPDLLLEIERNEAPSDAALIAFAKKVEVVADDKLDALCPGRYPATLELFVNQDLLTAITITDAWGDPANPFDIRSAREKFRRLVDRVLTAEEAMRVESCCLNILNDPTAKHELALALASIDKSCEKSAVSSNASCVAAV